MSKTLTRILAMLQGILLLTAAALFTVNLCCFQRSFYEKEYAKLDTAAEMGMEHADLMEATDVLLDYLKGFRIDLNLQTTVHGETVEMFDVRERPTCSMSGSCTTGPWRSAGSPWALR